MRSIRDGISDARGIGPVFADDNGYRDQEAELLHEYTDGETTEKLQQFARREAVKETRRATYQAMEAFVHNLNTMHSRAGAQIDRYGPLRHGGGHHEGG